MTFFIRTFILCSRAFFFFVFFCCGTYAYTYKNLKEVKFPKDSGIDPERWLCSRPKLTSFSNLPISLGMDPLMLFSDTSLLPKKKKKKGLFRPLLLGVLLGSQVVNWIKKDIGTYKYWRLVKFPSSGTSGPDSLAFARSLQFYKPNKIY